VLPNQWDELLRGNQKRHRIHKTQQPQNDEPRQPIRIPECEQPLKEVFLIHRREKTSNAEPAFAITTARQASNVQRSMRNYFGNLKFNLLPGGRFELPTKGL
jgi:hypothetical protein